MSSILTEGLGLRNWSRLSLRKIYTLAKYPYRLHIIIFVNNTNIILKLGWLPVMERRDFCLLKSVFKAMYNNQWPSYLSLQVVNNIRCLRSSALTTPLEKGTFQDSAAILFKSPYSNITTCRDFKQYCRLTRAFLRGRAADLLDTL